jgi:carboxymethylenebutenolidase
MGELRRLATLVVAIAWATHVPAYAAELITSTDVVYWREGGNKVSGFIARPISGQNRPGLVLVHEWWGLTDTIRDLARRFAEQGYVALAVDLYDGKSTDDPAQARRLMTIVNEDQERAFANLGAAVAHLKKHPSVAESRIGSVGWCFGGGWSYQIARNNLGVRASVIYYGPFNPRDDLAQMRAQIIGHFAENDRSIRVDDVRAFQARLNTLGGNHEIYIYPNTTHGFATDPQVYDEAAAELAWQRTQEFLSRYL